MLSIKGKANELIDKYGTNCPFKIAKMMGIIITYENLGNTLGYFSKNFRVPIIHINEKASEYGKKFICGHELGHVILHPEVNTPFLKKSTFYSADKKEKEANIFAIELLFPDSMLEVENITIYEALEQYKIPKNLTKLNY
ncbi:ImmA/IrrE family metallo-endopeptidase [Heyndrickxia oleronia]|jgi:Zn-dependent peptidase ImmA (M78 family)|uniref:ImmA/IrrE family metallo-endopeptidase n=3 Tax=Heyndrickxia oleronia TaxID=38875 RepID=A0AAW6SP12_9BACI|nr:ImmA/IrrE family metallo-endopeptidase [Heyndrickxia oleronia]MCI1591923.1 ImmA/IrrE family metallo-endopeptidase [Heyndrickxia oleronia]MCI1612773.1 ImmA/IrrE family metallo-endopeptidase [Heyndrickxia oleronia]MCI1743969.1 ImmA/IrrE family metallo-endopeptidase [Heyndrickxia oleronia]MCI1760683.1 ImmA/IrrE family metallo-endopeptidase [Heyndrickxia oleronia]MCM3237294.1 ImmA/IrrE family metallo-endopeptidase [Heyndrickxia oleronia]